MTPEDVILISGLEFYAFHGASDEEQAIGHRYRVEARLTVDTRPAGASDALSDTVDYGQVAQHIVSLGTTTQFRLLEALAQRLTETLFVAFPLIQALWLRVEKLHPPINAIAGSVGVEITRRREDETAEKG